MVIITSPDGINWSRQDVPSGAQESIWISVTWGGPSGNERFVDVALPDDERIMTSLDEINWTFGV